MAGGGGAWKVAYADFVTAMMAFFMVMWITSQNQQIKESVAHYFSDPFGALDANGKSGGAEATGPVLNPEPGQRFSVKPTIIREYNSKQFELGAIVYFEPGVADLDRNAKAAIETLVPFLEGKDYIVEIRGHATSAIGQGDVPNSKFEDTWSLSCMRCLAVRKYLEEWGVGAPRMRLYQAGEHEPSTNNKQHQRRYENDRVEIYVPRQVADERAEAARQEGA